MGRPQQHREFPRTVARLMGLEGGAYGEILLKAVTRHQLELDLGNEFVLFNREQACALRDAVLAFLELAPHKEERHEERREDRHGENHEVQDIAHAIEELAEEIVQEARPRRRRPGG